jgi:hypothetical protein
LRSANKENETKIRIGVSQGYPTRTADTGRPLAQNRITRRESDQNRARHPAGERGWQRFRRDAPSHPVRSPRSPAGARKVGDRVVPPPACSELFRDAVAVRPQYLAPPLLRVCGKHEPPRLQELLGGYDGDRLDLFVFAGLHRPDVDVIDIRQPFLFVQVEIPSAPECPACVTTPRRDGSPDAHLTMLKGRSLRSILILRIHASRGRPLKIHPAGYGRAWWR